MLRSLYVLNFDSGPLSLFAEAIGNKSFFFIYVNQSDLEERFAETFKIQCGGPCKHLSE